MKTTTFSVSAIFAATAAALTLSTAAFAANPAGQAASNPLQESTVNGSVEGKGVERGEKGLHKGGHHHKHMKHRMADAGLSVPGYGVVSKRFVETLALTEAQSRLVEDARTAQKQLRTQRGEGMKTAIQEKRDQVKQGKIDPRQALKQADERHEKLRAERRQIDEKWLAAWEALDAAQQQKVVAHMNERAEKLAKRMEERKSRKHGDEARPAKTADTVAS